MKIINTSIIYDNPLPQLRSRQNFFPNIVECSNGELLAVSAIGEAFESVDSTCYAIRSTDGGKTWGTPVHMFDTSEFDTAITDYSKASRLPDGTLVAFGYAYIRENEELPLGNPETGGVLDDFIFISYSKDNGASWSKMEKIECSWGPHVEASAPLYILKDGTFISPIAGFPTWNGEMTGPVCGRAIRSEDGGKTWSDNSVCMDFGRPVTCYEQRMCQLDSGAIINIGWNEDIETGERLDNHYTVSYDNGITWSAPVSTGVKGQASGVCALGGEKLLALHAVRRDTDRPGIYACVVDFSDREWNVIEEEIIWEPNTPILKDTKMAEIFSFLKFGQPGATLLSDGDVMMTHWYCEQGQYKTLATRIKI